MVYFFFFNSVGCFTILSNTNIKSDKEKKLDIKFRYLISILKWNTNINIYISILSKNEYG
jgi:hypothetical protein